MIIDLYDGKYSVENKNGILEIYRYHERWKSKELDYRGDSFVLSLVQELEEKIEENKKLEESLNQYKEYAEIDLDVY